MPSNRSTEGERGAGAKSNHSKLAAAQQKAMIMWWNGTDFKQRYAWQPYLRGTAISACAEGVETDVKRHRTPLHALMNDFEADIRGVETVKATRWDATWRSRLNTVIAGSRIEAVRAESSDRMRIKVYTDGSGYKGQVGATAVMTKNGATMGSTEKEHRDQADDMLDTGHEGVEGNKRVDKAVREAAEGWVSKKSSLPAPLQEKDVIKRSKAAEIQAYEVKLKKRARKGWKLSEREDIKGAQEGSRKHDQMAGKHHYTIVDQTRTFVQALAQNRSRPIADVLSMQSI
ncbi:RNA-directed DNA polymerase from transposon X-element [Salix suchowensis]|nr:RNA-directed DNA polymerase from transposon X-element [Salix suchowensis]